MRGLAIVYHVQLHNLESKYQYKLKLLEDTKNLLSMLNGDHLWNNIQN